MQVAGQQVSNGYVLEIEDRGLGMTDDELVEANERLANPPMVDFALSRMLGLYVVARLAQRYNIKVQLRHSWYGGITALVLLPPTVAVRAPMPEAIEAPARRGPAELVPSTKPVEPPVAEEGGEHLPIFEAARSDWFEDSVRGDHLPLRRHAAQQPNGRAAEPTGNGAGTLTGAGATRTPRPRPEGPAPVPAGAPLPTAAHGPGPDEARTDADRAEAMRAEAMRVETARMEAARAEAGRVEEARSAAAREAARPGDGAPAADRPRTARDQAAEAAAAPGAGARARTGRCRPGPQGRRARRQAAPSRSRPRRRPAGSRWPRPRRRPAVRAAAPGPTGSGPSACAPTGSGPPSRPRPAPGRSRPRAGRSDGRGRHRDRSGAEPPGGLGPDDQGRPSPQGPAGEPRPRDGRRAHDGDRRDGAGRQLPALLRGGQVPGGGPEHAVELPLGPRARPDGSRRRCRQRRRRPFVLEERRR